MSNHSIETALVFIDKQFYQSLPEDKRNAVDKIDFNKISIETNTEVRSDEAELLKAFDFKPLVKDQKKIKSIGFKSLSKYFANSTQENKDLQSLFDAMNACGVTPWKVERQ